MRNLCIAFLVFGIACNTGGTTGGTIDAPRDAGSGGPVDAFSSECGFPGDTGDVNGIGQFCTMLSDCPSSAPLCSHFGDPNTFFCTITCPVGDPQDVCGSGNTCTCEGSNGPCGCTPNVCLTGGSGSSGGSGSGSGA